MKTENQAKQNYYSIDDLEELTEWRELDTMLATLPIGIEHNGDFITNAEYELKTFTGNEEIALGQLEDRYGADNILRILQTFLPTAIATIDRHSIRELVSPQASRVPGVLQPSSVSDFISHLYVGDVIAIVVSLRVEAQHWGIPIGSMCPNCSAKIKPKAEEEYHDLRGLRFKVWRAKFPPVFCYELENPLEDRAFVLLSPPRLGESFDPGFRDSNLATDTKISILLSDLDEDTYYLLAKRDRAKLKDWANAVNSIGMELGIGMYCPECDFEWDSPLVLGINHPEYFLSLLQAPKGEDGDTRDYLFEIVKFLCQGEQAPFKSATEVLNLTPKIRNKMVTDLAASYQEQARKMKSK